MQYQPQQHELSDHQLAQDGISRLKGVAPPTVSRDKTSQGRDAPTRVRKQQRQQQKQRAAEAHSNVQQQHQLTASGTPTAVRSLVEQMPLLSEGAGRNRATSVGSWRKVAIAVAALQGAVSCKSRHDGSWPCKSAIV